MSRSGLTLVLCTLGLMTEGCQDAPHRCQPECEEGKVCREGKCMPDMQDSGPPDQTPLPDKAVPDQAALDKAPLPDQAPLPDLKPWVPPGTWVIIQAGTFQMGSHSTEPCRDPNEDQHQVTLTHAYEIQSTEVTQGQFYLVLGYSPSYFSSCGSNCPVETVSWYEAAAYCNALSVKSGKGPCYSCTGSGVSVKCTEGSPYTGAGIYTCPGYRLPTEAEWEHAYRAGTTTAYYSGANNGSACTSCIKDVNAHNIGWYCHNSKVSYSGCFNMTASGGPACAGVNPVATKTANAWGLYDMAGNVWEWCNDWYRSSLGFSAVTDPVGSGSVYRVVRGGAWYLGTYGMRAAARYYVTPSSQFYPFGFRCSRTK